MFIQLMFCCRLKQDVFYVEKMFSSSKNINCEIKI
jgi:hypothetical protein